MQPPWLAVSWRTCCLAYPLSAQHLCDFAICLWSSAKSKWCFLGLYFTWTRHFPESSVTHWPFLARCMQWTSHHHTRLWPHVTPQPNLDHAQFATEAAGFPPPGQEAGQGLGEASALISQPATPVLWDEEQNGVYLVKPDLCQSVMPASDRRPFNEDASAMAEHFCCCHAVLPPQAVPRDPAGQECVTQHVLSLPRSWEVHCQVCQTNRDKRNFLVGTAALTPSRSPLCLGGAQGSCQVSLHNWVFLSSKQRGHSRDFYLFASPFHWWLFPL